MVVTYNMTIQAVFFDLGGVILMEAARDFGIDARFSLMPGTVTRCLDVNSRWKEARVGHCSYEEWVDSVREALVEEAGGQADEVLQEALKAEAPVNEAVMRLVSALSVRYRIGAISNTKTRDLERFIKRRFGPLFEVVVGSADLGVAKPDPDIYLHAARRLSLRPKACVFIDDVEANANGATAVGMNGILFESTQQLVRDLDALRVQV